MDQRICIEEGCSRPAPQNVKQGRRCYTCRRKRQRANRKPRPCRKCRELTQFPVRGLCDRCRCRERVANLPVGTCEDCGRQRPIMARGRCNSCYQSHMRRQRPKTKCPGCGKLEHVWSSGKCSRCKSRDEREARKVKEARRAIAQEGDFIAVRVRAGVLTLWMAVEVGHTSDLLSLADAVPRASKLLIGRAQERLSTRGMNEARKGAS